MSKLTKIVLASAGMVVALTMVVGVGATTASAQSMSLADLITFMINAGIIPADKAAAARAAIGGTTTTTTTTGGYTFTKDLTMGSKGADVEALQKAIGMTMPAGVAYGYFGTLTKNAVIAFQKDNNIAPAAGYVGPKTIAFLNGMGGTVTTPGTGTTVPMTGAVSITLGSAAANSVIVQGQASANLGSFTFTNGSANTAVVTNVTLNKIGVASDSLLKNVYLYNGAARLTDSASVASGKITFNGSSLFTIPAGSAVTVTVKADIETKANVDAGGQVIGVALTNVASTVTTQANFPILGSTMSVASVGVSDLGSVKVETIYPAVTAQNTQVLAGNLNYPIFRAALTVSKKVRLSSVALKVIGSVPTDALQNISLYMAGTKVASATGIDSNGYMNFDLSANPYFMDSSRTMEVRADVIKGSDRTFTVSIQNDSDISLIDDSFNVGITPSFAGVKTTNTIKVSTGTLSINQDSSLSDDNVVTGTTGVVLGRWSFKAYGEDMKISSLNIQSNVKLDKVALFADNSQVGSDRAITATGTEFAINSLSVIIPAGKTVTIEARGDMKYNGSNLATSTSVKVGLTGVSSNTQGVQSSIVTMYPTTGITAWGVSRSVVSAGFTATKSSLFSAQSYTPNSGSKRIASFSLSADSSEDVMVNGLTIDLAGSIAAADLSDLKVVISGEADNISTVNPVNATGNYFSANFTVAKNATKVVDVYANIGDISGTTTVSAMKVTGNGYPSNLTIEKTSNAGQIVTVTSGTLNSLTVDSNSMSSQLVIGPMTDVNLLTLRATSNNGTSYINEVTFNATGSVAAISIGGIKKDVTVGTPLTITGLNIAVPTNVTTLIQVKADILPVGKDTGTASNATTTIAVSSVKWKSGTSSTTAQTAGSAAIYPVTGKPTLTLSAAGNRATGLMTTLNLTANSGEVKVNSLTLNIKSVGSGVSLATGTVISFKKDDNAATVLATSTVTGTNTNGTVTVTFPSNFNASISQGATVMVYAATSGMTYSSTDSIAGWDVSLGARSTLNWTDVDGNTTLTGTYLSTSEYNDVNSTTAVR